MEKFEGPSDYATPGSIVKRKDGRSRFVVDYSTGLNAQLEEPAYQLPVPEDIYNQLSGYEESQMLTVVSTPFGKYKYKVASMGLKTLPADFQRIMDDMFIDMPFAHAYFDDILIASVTSAEHLMHVRAVLRRIQQWCIRLSFKKCKFFQTSIRFLGRLIDANGIHHDPSKIDAIQTMATPTDVSPLRSFLGMVNFYQNFVSMMRDLRQPLDELLKKDVTWCWIDTHDKTVHDIKATISSKCMLTHFDPRLPITVAADASQHGIGE
uniref:Reverse transcriptase domain-containing protein n=1 Tax=Panagrolaimus sp. ES5 TaxID=591445 RepID=A0AC34GAF2_9BILA